MNLLDLMSLQSLAEKVTLDSPMEAISPILRKFGIEDDEMAARVLGAAQLVSQDPTETVMAFIKNGGLLRLVAGQKHNPDEEDQIIQCPHCEEMIVL